MPSALVICAPLRYEGDGLGGAPQGQVSRGRYLDLRSLGQEASEVDGLGELEGRPGVSRDTHDASPELVVTSRLVTRHRRHVHGEGAARDLHPLDGDRPADAGPTNGFGALPDVTPILPFLVHRPVDCHGDNGVCPLRLPRELIGKFL